MFFEPDADYLVLYFGAKMGIGKLHAKVYYCGETPKIVTRRQIPGNAALVSRDPIMFVQFGKNALMFTNGIFWLADDIEETHCNYFWWEKHASDWFINVAITSPTSQFLSGLYRFRKGKTFKENTLEWVGSKKKGYHFIGPHSRGIILTEDLMKSLQMTTVTYRGSTFYVPKKLIEDIMEVML